MVQKQIHIWSFHLSQASDMQYNARSFWAADDESKQQMLHNVVLLNKLGCSVS